MWIKKIIKNLTKFAKQHMKRIIAVLTGFVGGMAPLLITITDELVDQTPGLPPKNVGQMIWECCCSRRQEDLSFSP